MAAKREHETEEKRTEAAAAAKGARAVLEAELNAVGTTSELLRVLRDANGAIASKDAYRAAWLRLVEAGDLQARHGIVEVHGRGTMGGWVLSRFGLTAQRGSWSPPIPRLDVWCSSNGSTWLDAEGVSYQRKPGEVRLSIQGERRTRYFVLPKDERMIVRRCADTGYGGTHRWFEVANGTQIGADNPDERQYARSLTMVLENSHVA